MHAQLPAVMTAPTEASPSHVTVSPVTAGVSSRVPAVVPAAAASSSRVSARSSFLNQPESESWMPTALIDTLVWSPASSASSLFSLLQQPRESTSSTASQALAGPAPPQSPCAIACDQPASEIIPAEAAVAIVVNATHYRVIGHYGFQLTLARRLVVVDRKGVLAD